MADRGDLALAIYFTVEVGGTDLGGWTKCEGLGAEVVMEQREEGGNNGFIWQLPTRIKYPNIKLTRPIGKDSTKLTEWLAGLASGVHPQTATITVRSSDAKVVTTWSLEGVLPVRWTGPNLDPDSPKIATETVELCHHGFLPGRVEE